MSVQKDAEKLEEVFDNLTSSIQEAATTSNKLRSTFLELSKSGTAAGQAWTVISRLTSGTGFWRIQNRVRAISNFLQFQDKRAEEIAKNENEAIKRLASQVKLKKEITSAQKLLTKIIDGSASSDERITFYKSEQYKYLEQILGPTEALLVMSDKLEYAQSRLAETDKDMLNQRVKNFKKLLKQGQSYTNMLTGKEIAGSTDTQLKRFNALTDAQQRTYIAYIDFSEKRKVYEDDYKESRKDVLKIEAKIAKSQGILKDREEKAKKELEEITNKIKDEEKKGEDASQIELKQLNAEYDALKKKHDKRIESMESRLSEQRKERKQLKENEKRLKDQIDDAQKEADKAKGDLKLENVDVSMKDGGTIENEPPKQSFGAKMLGKVTKVLDKIPGGNLITGIFKGMAKFHKDHPTMKDKMAKAQEMFKGFARLAIKMLRGMFIWIPLLIFALMALKEAGFFDMISNFISSVGRFLYNIYQGVVEIFVAIGDVFGATIAFFGALFNGESGEAWDALWVLLGSLWELFTAFIELFFVDILWGLVVLFFEGLFGHYFAEGVSKFDSIASMVYDLVLFAGAMKIFFLTLPISLPAAIIAGFSALIFGAKVKNFLLGLVGLDGAMADGGTVNKTGSYLVGERGPEVVSLNAGNYVTPNNQLGGSTVNNITVNVNGRLGASDTELNDLANKLSRKISLEMQRTSPTGIYR